MHNHERQAPDIDVRTFGPRDQVRLVNRLRGDELAEFFPLTNWLPEIESALATLSPLRRFVVEARTRGKTQREVANLVGWNSHTRVQQVEGHAYRLLRLFERSGELQRLMKEFRAVHFCELERTDEREPFHLGCRVFMFAVKRCKLCRRKPSNDPRCSAKPLTVVQMELGL
jgi:hypothetical protein